MHVPAVPLFRDATGRRVALTAWPAIAARSYIKYLLFTRNWILSFCS